MKRVSVTPCAGSMPSVNFAKWFPETAGTPFCSRILTVRVLPRLFGGALGKTNGPCSIFINGLGHSTVWEWSPTTVAVIGVDSISALFAPQTSYSKSENPELVPPVPAHFIASDFLLKMKGQPVEGFNHGKKFAVLAHNPEDERITPLLERPEILPDVMLTLNNEGLLCSANKDGALERVSFSDCSIVDFAEPGVEKALEEIGMRYVEERARQAFSDLGPNKLHGSPKDIFSRLFLLGAGFEFSSSNAHNLTSIFLEKVIISEMKKRGIPTPNKTACGAYTDRTENPSHVIKSPESTRTMHLENSGHDYYGGRSSD